MNLFHVYKLIPITTTGHDAVSQALVHQKLREISCQNRLYREDWHTHTTRQTAAVYVKFLPQLSKNYNRDHVVGDIECISTSLFLSKCWKAEQNQIYNQNLFSLFLQLVLGGYWMLWLKCNMGNRSLQSPGSSWWIHMKIKHTNVAIGSCLQSSYDWTSGKPKLWHLSE